MSSGATFEDAVCLDGVSTGQREAELADTGQGGAGQAFVKFVHEGRLRGSGKFGEPGLPAAADLRRQEEQVPDPGEQRFVQ